ncbi:hypothetical protein C8J57DRAFT_369441 [Mycena rebaudengoi]|nr:hypothetical protein C8J57DRAFT_369441 [Mycena rebaudengoi]
MIPSPGTGASDIKRKKPPACDYCRTRRVLCHPQPDGLPCPRCIEKNSICTTTPVIRAKRRKTPSASVEPILPILTGVESGPHCDPLLKPLSTQSSWDATSSAASDCPALTPELVRHFFECFVRLPEYMHPIFSHTAIEKAIQAASFRLNLLPTQSRVLAICIIALTSLISFDEAVLGSGPRPQSFSDTQFFLSDADARSCAARRAPACRALHLEALKAAWDAKIMLEVSVENAASCYILSYLELYEYHDGPSRPWASAFASHLRSIASTWKRSDIERYQCHWAGYLMAEAIATTRHRKPSLMTTNDQTLICGPEPASLQTLLTSLENSPQRRDISIILAYMTPYAFHITSLARQLYETIIGDYARSHPLSEAAVIDFISSLTTLRSIHTIILEPLDALILCSPPTVDATLTGVGSNLTATCGFGIVLGFTELLLPFYRELQRRTNAANTAVGNEHSHAPLVLLRNQTHEMVVLAAGLFGKGLRYLPPMVHHAHTQWASLAAWAEFCLDEVDDSVVPFAQHLQMLETIAAKLNEIGYSLDLSPYTGLIQRLEDYISAQRIPAFERSPQSSSESDFIPIKNTSGVELQSLL